ncbi:DUF5104 domain-containing protein [Mogibacterium pumilum]|uniref:DUF5104 domain-containing protein n=1 Tax=Mogibacterium pumilum TaxID=86332 RepID=A0A223AU07_9FIRM|nr:DUF5104 domain-containing protein [Mogibacterium pumilum]ASS38399.1 hypothetical protein AXF17_08350 [Mogibacterium pumilum]
MRKLTCALLCLLMIISAVFCLEGCKSREQRLSEETAYEDAQMNAMNKKVVKCINEQDKEGLKKLFSKDVQKHIEDLDGKIDEMLEAFKGESIVSVKSEPVDSSRTYDYGKKSITIYGDYELNLDNGKKYILLISYCDTDDENKSSVGIFKLTLLTFSNEMLPEDFRMGSSVDDHGIFIYTLQNYPKK